MYIDLSQLEGDELCLEHHYSEPFELPDHDVRVVSAPVIGLRLQRVAAGEFRARGHVVATVQVPCDRCLSDFSLPIDVTFDVLYAPIETLTPAEDVPLASKDLAYGFYRDNLLDVDGLVREQIFLALPFRWLCNPQCRGLCPQCGKDLNCESCSCTQETVAPYWSALLELRRTEK